eukprot:TRINITY_DN16755_c0_g2_i1.p1 TRINITY_DN16755_c0_g2~~TRINITY_DN16755_c0_g2_i1.p1  ORF type:complete len:710 (+),score=154.18 TRINITY_DN16755_c0_g2_i1:83-2131(+)
MRTIRVHGEQYNVRLVGDAMGLDLRVWAFENWGAVPCCPVVMHIHHVYPGGAADQAGLLPGQLVAADGQCPTTQQDLVDCITRVKSRPDRTLSVVVADWAYRYEINNPAGDDLGMDFEVVEIERSPGVYIRITNVEPGGVADLAVITPRSRDVRAWAEGHSERACTLFAPGREVYLVRVDGRDVRTREDLVAAVRNGKSRYVIETTSRPWELNQHFDVVLEDPKEDPPLPPPTGTDPEGSQWQPIRPDVPLQEEQQDAGGRQPSGGAQTAADQRDWWDSWSTARLQDGAPDWPGTAEEPKEERVQVLIDGEVHRCIVLSANLRDPSGGPPRTHFGARCVLCGFTSAADQEFNGRGCVVTNPDDDIIPQQNSRLQAAARARAAASRRVDWVEWIRGRQAAGAQPPRQPAPQPQHSAPTPPGAGGAPSMQAPAERAPGPRTLSALAQTPALHGGAGSRRGSWAPQSAQTLPSLAPSHSRISQRRGSTGSGALPLVPELSRLTSGEIGAPQVDRRRSVQAGPSCMRPCGAGPSTSRARRRSVIVLDRASSRALSAPGPERRESASTEASSQVTVLTDERNATQPALESAPRPPELRQRGWSDGATVHFSSSQPRSRPPPLSTPGNGPGAGCGAAPVTPWTCQAPPTTPWTPAPNVGGRRAAPAAPFIVPVRVGGTSMSPPRGTTR